MSDKKYKEFWIDSLPIFNGDNIVSWKRAYTNEQDGFEKHKGNELYHVIEYSAYEQLKAENEVLKRELADERSGDCDKDKTIRRLESNFKALEEQNRVLVEALEFYAHPLSWDWPITGDEENSMITDDFDVPEGLCDARGGKRARQALALTKGEK